MGTSAGGGPRRGAGSVSAPEFIVCSLILTVASQPATASRTAQRASRRPNALTRAQGKVGLENHQHQGDEGASVATEPRDGPASM